ncbi:unnamed protein product [Urochloa humidicola]
MPSATKTARLLLLLQIAVFVVSAVIMGSGSVCYGGARDGINPGGLHPDRPACIGEQCPTTRPGYPDGPRRLCGYLPYHCGQSGWPGRTGIRHGNTPAEPPNGEIPRP